jgi:hypothetical protein
MVDLHREVSSTAIQNFIQNFETTMPIETTSVDRNNHFDLNGSPTILSYKTQKHPATLPSSHNSSAGERVQRHCQLGMDVLEKQQAWYKTYGATLCRRPLHASSRTTTKAALHTQCDGYGLRYEYTGTHPSRTSRYEWL